MTVPEEGDETATKPKSPLVALISATPAAIGPVVSGLSREFPGAMPWNILDDRLRKDANDSGGVTVPLARRMTRLINHTLTEGADGVLLTCSMYGPTAHTFPTAHPFPTAHTFPTADVPILAPDDAASGTAIGGGFGCILLVATFEAALRDAEARFGQAVVQAGAEAEFEGTFSPAAFEATQAGDDAALLRALDEACRPFLGRVDAVLLAQYSLAPVATELSERLGIPVISGPDAAAKLLGSRIQSEG